MILKNHSRVIIAGGGPSGAFFAIHLLKEAKKAGIQLALTIIDKRITSETAIPKESWRFKGCNYCAGVISPILHAALNEYDIKLPDEIISEDFSHVWIHGQWKNFPLKVPPGQKLCAVFRGSLPPEREKHSSGFDAFLLEKAVAEGASIMPGTVQDLKLSSRQKPYLTIKNSWGSLSEIESDFVCICCGVNAFISKKTKENPLLVALKTINPDFKPPKVRPTLIFEMRPGRKYIKKHMSKELYLIVSGSKKLNLEHIAIVPKGEYLSIALVGKSIDTAVFPEDTKKLIDAFLALPHVKTILPGITPKNAPVSCSCNPMMAISPSVSPSVNRISMAGDILGARLYRDGLYSAFASARIMAEAVIQEGIDKRSLRTAEKRITQWLKKDNQYCKCIFSIMQTALKSDLFSRILYQTFATEMKFKKIGSWPLGSVLWKVGSGTADYKSILRELTSFLVLRSFSVGIFKTFRNIITEYFFDLKWGSYGRYPTVILKDKREAIKKSIQDPLGIKLDNNPQMERMYAIKIRASSETIFNELAKFGSIQAKFLRLRFVDVKRTSGEPNQIGSIVTYHLKNSPITMDIRLIKTVKGKTLLYEPQELFTTRGVLLFDITPTLDGNHRLVIYTAFDYKQGRGLISKAFFILFKYLFPDFAHDVVWNHAVCTIKAEAERNEGASNQTKNIF